MADWMMQNTHQSR